jgi:hypothetical protein
MPNGRRVHGNFRSILERLPDAVTNELKAGLEQTGRIVLSRAQALAPVYQGKPRKGLVSGALRSGLSAKVTPKSLKLKVGLVGKPINRKLFYGWLVERGHRIGYRDNRLQRLEPVKGRSSTARLERARRRRDVRLNGVPPHPFLYTFNRQELYQPFQKIWGRAMHAAISGAVDE